jgi:WD40 repeat protein
MWDPHGGGTHQLRAPAAEAPLSALTQVGRDPGVWMGFSNGAIYHLDPLTGEALPLHLHGEDPVEILVANPENQTLLAASSAGAVRLWQWQRHRVKPVGPIGPVLPHPEGVRGLALSPTGTQLATIGAHARDGPPALLHLWDIHGRRPVASRQAGPALRATRTAFRPDGRQVLVAGEIPQGGIEVHLYDFDPAEPAGRPPLTLPSPPGGEEGRVRGAAEPTPAPLVQKIPLPHDGAVRAAAFSADGRQVATGSGTGRVWRWDTATGKLLGSQLDTGHEVNALAFSPRDPLLAVGTAGGAVLWRWDQQTPAAAPLEPREPVPVLTFSPDGRYLAIGKFGAATLWDVDAGRLRAAPFAHPDLVLLLAWAPDCRTLLTGSFGKTLQRWDAATGQRGGAPLLPKGMNTVVAFSPDSSTFVTGSAQGVVQCWDTSTGRTVGPPLTLGYMVSAAAFTPDGRLLLTATYNQHLCSWTVPAPLDGDPRRLVLWLNAVLGVDMDEAGALHALDAAAWRDCCQRLEEAGGPPPP